MTPESVLALRDLLCEMLAREMQITQAVIAAVPEYGRDFRHEPRARTAFELAWHIASSQVFFLDAIAGGGFDFERARSRGAAPPPAFRDVVLWLAENGAAGLERVRALPAEALLQPIFFKPGNMTLPAWRFLLIANSHAIHHRGQLSTCLRPLGARVPAIYGESADSAPPAPRPAAG